MFLTLVCLAIAALVAFALYSANRSAGGPVVSESDLGGINAYDSYYGKDRFSYPGGAPCEVCAPKGCIGVGNCRCACHYGKKSADASA